ncbi:MAG: RNA polymerase sigma factor [Bacteroidota bacterium]
MIKAHAAKEHVLDLIIHEYKERLYWHIRKIVISHDDADDVLQNTFIKVWKGLDNFRAESKVFTWLYRIATNEAISFLHKKKKHFLLPIHDVEKELIKNLESDEYFSGNEIQLVLQRAILKLPEKQRIVFNMKYFEEMKYSDMSAILDTSEGALKASYHHAVKKIKDFIETD